MYVVSDCTYPLCQKSQRFFGAHTIHYDLGEDSEAGVDSEGIASVAASLDWPKFRKYHTLISHQPHNGIINLHSRRGGMMTKFFRSFYKMIKERPKRIIFYRGGLMEGEMERICLQEIDAIKQACAYSYKEDQPSLTYVVVVPTASIGTEADTAKYKFFCRHTTHKSTSRVVRYHVVHDDNNFLAGELQSLTLKLFTFRHRREYPKIDAVVPAYYAERAAFKGYRAECAAFKAYRDKCAASKAS